VESVAAQTQAQKIGHALALITSSRDPLMQHFGRYLRASSALEVWLASGAPMDEESAKAIVDDVRASLESLSMLGTLALSIAGVSGRAVGLEPDVSRTN
jgi:hypothetical protein